MQIKAYKVPYFFLENLEYWSTTSVRTGLFVLRDKVKPLICCKLTQHSVHNISSHFHIKTSPTPLLRLTPDS